MKRNKARALIQFPLIVKTNKQIPNNTLHYLKVSFLFGGLLEPAVSAMQNINRESLWLMQAHTSLEKI